MTRKRLKTGHRVNANDRFAAATSPVATALNVALRWASRNSPSRFCAFLQPDERCGASNVASALADPSELARNSGALCGATAPPAADMRPRPSSLTTRRRSSAARRRTKGKLKTKLPILLGSEECFCARQWLAPPMKGDFGALLSGTPSGSICVSRSAIATSRICSPSGGPDVSYETVRRWVSKFGPMFAQELRRQTPAPNVAVAYEMAVMIAGQQFWLRRAVDHEGEVLEAVATARRDKAAALKLLKRIMKNFGLPQSIVTDKLRAHSAAMKEISAADRHQVGGAPQQSRREFASAVSTTGAGDAAVSKYEDAAEIQFSSRPGP